MKTVINTVIIDNKSCKILYLGIWKRVNNRNEVRVKVRNRITVKFH